HPYVLVNAPFTTFPGPWGVPLTGLRGGGDGPNNPGMGMKVVLMPSEYPPNVYGGAGVHVEHLTRELPRLIEVEVRRFGPAPVSADRSPGEPTVLTIDPWDRLSGGAPHFGAVRTMSVDLAMA